MHGTGFQIQGWVAVIEAKCVKIGMVLNASAGSPLSDI